MLGSGTRLGSYELLAPLGVGGMGEVYRARDTKLGREVALKVLPEHLASDPDRLARFQREAQVLASLNHPHIAAIYGLEDADGVRALVLELVEGETLADRIARGPLPLDDALAIARQIAEAVEAAHEQGVIHRDLKPANIKVTPDGNVKVLDFGLAKLVEQSSAITSPPSVTLSPTITSPAMMTGLGMILGTAAYMSPEQAKGRTADKRSDVWSFGAVLYEALTGQRPFAGNNVSEIVAAVLRDEPDWTALPADTPATVVKLLRRCLDKDPRKRLPHIAIAGYEIAENSSASPTVHSNAGARKFSWRGVAALLLSAVLGGAIATGIWSVRRTEDPVPMVTRFAVALPSSEQITDPQHRSVAISPDGTRIVYVANRLLHLRSLADPNSRQIGVADETTTGQVGTPVFSPDGRSVAYVWRSGQTAAIGSIRIADISGTTSTRIADFQSNNTVGLSWSGNDILFSDARVGVVRVAVGSGRQETLVPATAEELFQGPTILPGGKVLLFALGKRRGPGVAPTPETWDQASIVAQRLGTRERVTLIQGGSEPHYLSSGHLLYANGGTIFIVPFDATRLMVTGERTAVLNGVARTVVGPLSTGMAQFSISDNGSVVYIAGAAARDADLSELAIIDRAGKAEPLKLPRGYYERPRVSPDGRRAAFALSQANGVGVWIYDLAGKTAMRQLTFEGKNQYPVWIDNERLAFQSDRGGDAAIWSQRSDGTADAERLTKPDTGTSHVPEALSPDGKHLLYSVENGSTNTLWVLSVDTKKSVRVADVESPRLLSPVFSPDGRWIAYTLTSGADNQVFVRPFPVTAARFLVGRGARAQWSPDGRELFFYNNEGTFVVNIAGGPAFSMTNPVLLPFNLYFGRGPGFGRDTDVLPDGRRFLAIVPQQGSTAIRELQVVLHWFDEVKPRLDAR